MYIDLIFIFLSLLCIGLLVCHNSEYFFITGTKYDSQTQKNVYDKYHIRKSLGQIKATARQSENN